MAATTARKGAFRYKSGKKQKVQKRRGGQEVQGGGVKVVKIKGLKKANRRAREKAAKRHDLHALRGLLLGTKATQNIAEQSIRPTFASPGGPLSQENRSSGYNWSWEQDASYATNGLNGRAGVTGSENEGTSHENRQGRGNFITAYQGGGEPDKTLLKGPGFAKKKQTQQQEQQQQNFKNAEDLMKKAVEYNDLVKQATATAPPPSPEKLKVLREKIAVLEEKIVEGSKLMPPTFWQSYNEYIKSGLTFAGAVGAEIPNLYTHNYINGFQVDIADLGADIAERYVALKPYVNYLDYLKYILPSPTPLGTLKSNASELVRMGMEKNDLLAQMRAIEEKEKEEEAWRAIYEKQGEIQRGFDRIESTDPDTGEKIYYYKGKPQFRGEFQEGFDRIEFRDPDTGGEKIFYREILPWDRVILPPNAVST
jgi:hypothetical protein